MTAKKKSKKTESNKKEIPGNKFLLALENARKKKLNWLKKTLKK